MIGEGHAVRGAADVLPLVRRQLRAGNVWSAREDATDLDGLSRAIADAGPLRPAFVDAVVASLRDPDVAVRTGAAAVLADVRADVDLAALVALLTDDARLLVGVPPRRHALGPHRDLASAVYAALAAEVQDRGDATPQVVEVLRRGAHEGRWVLAALARVDAEWLIAHAPEVVPEAAIGGVVLHLATHELRRRLLLALGPWPPEASERVLAQRWWRALPDTEATQLRALLTDAK